jgi:GcrA cell cycle regulator
MGRNSFAALGPRTPQAYMTKKSKKLKTVETLESNDCRWPIGDPRHPEFHFCGAPRVSGRPYCAAHWQMAFQPARPRTQPAPLILPDRRAA